MQGTASRQPGAGPGTQARPAGCYKCGKQGHWAKDCTAPQSQWVNRQQGGAGGGGGGTAARRAPGGRNR